jgi:hypothetical protein
MFKNHIYAEDEKDAIAQTQMQYPESVIGGAYLDPDWENTHRWCIVVCSKRDMTIQELDHWIIMVINETKEILKQSARTNEDKQFCLGRIDAFREMQRKVHRSKQKADILFCESGLDADYWREEGQDCSGDMKER